VPAASTCVRGRSAPARLAKRWRRPGSRRRARAGAAVTRRARACCSTGPSARSTPLAPSFDLPEAGRRRLSGLTKAAVAQAFHLR
jgi:hypothetical protein